MTIRVDLAGTVFLTSLAIWLLYFAPLSASNTGFSLAMAGAFMFLLFTRRHIEQLLQRHSAIMFGLGSASSMISRSQVCSLIAPLRWMYHNPIVQVTAWNVSSNTSSLNMSHHQLRTVYLPPTGLQAVLLRSTTCLPDTLSYVKPPS